MQTYPYQNYSSSRVALPIPRTERRSATLAPAAQNRTKFIIFTVGVVLFCALAAGITWELGSFFTNFSYKAATVFLSLITTSNVFGKYAVWLLKH